MSKAGCIYIILLRAFQGQAQTCLSQLDQRQSHRMGLISEVKAFFVKGIKQIMGEREHFFE